MFARGPEAVSPTAHYTGAVWSRAGLSHPALATGEGRLMHGALQPAMRAWGLLGGPALEDLLLARHRVIDHLLTAAIGDGRVGQVVEIAAGLSPRGWRFTERHGDALAYVEADLPAMAQRKRRLLERAGAAPRVVALDAFSADGLDELAATLDPARGVAVVTEGLLNYFHRAPVEDLWRRIAGMLAGFPSGLYLSDLHLLRQTEAAGASAKAFRGLLSAFVRRGIHVHFADEAEARAALLAAGFATADVHAPAAFALEGTDTPGAGLVRIVEARTG